MGRSASPDATVATDRAAPPTWSVSRHATLWGCERQLYWRYWGSAGGWSESAPPDARRAWVLKHLTSVPLVIGQAVHSAARRLVTDIRDCAPRQTMSAMLDSARTALNQVWRSSQPDRIDRFWISPGVYPALQELVYGHALSAEAIDAARAKLATCVRHLATARVLADLAETPAHEIKPGAPVPARFLVDVDLPVWVALDLAYQHHNPDTCRQLVSGATWCVTDWKTGRPDPEMERLQLSTYALSLAAVGYPATDGRYLGRVVHLLLGAETWYALTERDLDATRAIIAADMARQRAFFVDVDRGVLKSRDAFALATDRRRCRSCAFFALCREELASTALHVGGRPLLSAPEQRPFFSQLV